MDLPYAVRAHVLPASITSAALLTGVYIAQIHGKAALRPQYDRLAREDKLPSTKAEEKIIEEEERKQHGNGDDDAPIRSEVWRTASSTVLAAALAILEVVQAIARHSRSSTWPWNIALAVSWVITASLFAAQAKRARLGKPASYELSTVLTTLLYAFAAIVDLRSAYLHHLPSHLNAAIASIACALLCIELISPRNSSPSAIGARPPSTIANASLLSRWTFFHIERLLYRNLRHPIEPSSVPDLLPEDKAASTLLQFRADVAELSSWRIFRGQRPSLQTQILYHVRGHLLRQALWAFVESFTSFAPALVLRQIVLFLERRARGEIAGSSEAIMWAVLLVGLQMADSLSGCQALIIGRQASIRVVPLLYRSLDQGLTVSQRHIGVGEIYAKVLRRVDNAGTSSIEGEVSNQQALTTTGKLQNLLSADVLRAAEALAYVQNIFPQGVISIILTVWLLYRLMGYSALVGTLILVLLIPIQSLLAKMWANISREVLTASDKRLHLAQEVIQAIRVVKAFAWERSFMQRMQKERDAELTALLKRALLSTAQLGVMFASTTVITAATFAIHVSFFHRPLDAATAFGALALFNALRFPLDTFAHMITYLIQASVSIKRIDAFLIEPETTKWDQQEAAPADAPTIGFVNATCSYDLILASPDASIHSKDALPFSLVDLNLDFPLGELSLIIGPVGSGKSTMLLSLLRETHLQVGSAYMPSPITRESTGDPAKGSVEATAYCSQAPWLLSDSIRANILFGHAMNSDRYSKVLEACALLPDIASLHAGDHTAVGERGVGLSGGQKARISLARAIYSNSRHVLLDDVLSAVDSHTAAHLLHRCLKGPLMQGRSCILVTNAVSLCLPAAKFLVALDAGLVAYSGEPIGAPAHLVAQAIQVDVETNAKEAAAPAVDENAEGEAESNEETHRAGAVKWSVWQLYMSAFGGPIAWSIVLVLFTLAQGSEILQNLQLRAWAGSYTSSTLHTFVLAPLSVSDGDSTARYFRLYVLLSLSTLVLFIGRSLWVLFRGWRAARTLYDQLIRSVVGARTRFFDTVPVGRILNRLARDVSVIDAELSYMLNFLILEVFWSTGIIAAIALVMPVFLVAAAILGAIFYIITSMYVSISRDLKRLESVTRSPIFGMVGESLNGITTIRAYGDGPRFFRQLFSMLDDNARPYWNLWLANRWLSVRTDMLGALVSFAVALFVTLRTDIDGALAGFMLSYAVTLQARLMWVARLSAEMQVNMNSVERVQEYLEIEHESTEGQKPPAAWPSREGELVFEGVVARYDESLPPVLKDVSFTVRPREKIGICGRTGSGKSTLGLCLLRFLELQAGRIVIDGHDISTVALDELRTRLVLIPQDASLFAGTIRLNLDPFGEFEDHQLWDALRRVQLVGRKATSRPDTPDGALTPLRDIVEGLDHEIAEGGKNLSSGQRQLVALARGLLKLQSCNILLLDEASASLDNATDEAVQRTIREEMSDATILCIAHRLLTIADFDRVLVLGDGEVLEFDEPATLLRDDKSAFSALARRSGEFEALKRLADSAELKRRSEH